MSLYLLAVGDNEDATIDNSGTPRTEHYGAIQAETPSSPPGLSLGIADRAFSYLPDPTVGQMPAPGNINGANDGPLPWNQTHVAPTGQIGYFPPIQQQMQGTVGRSQLAARQYAGTLQQLSAYAPSQLEAAANLVGIQLRPGVLNG